MNITITRHGITWEIEGSPQIANYANGDFAVVGPFTLLGVTSADGAVTGSMSNPSPTRRAQGFFPVPWDNQQSPYLAYDPTLGLTLPRVVQPGESIVSASRMPTGSMPYVANAAVLTCVSTPPEPTDFRPSYAGGTKVTASTIGMRHPNLGMRTRMPTLTPNITPSAFEGVWLDFYPGWSVRTLHPNSNMPNYGRDLSTKVGSGMLSLAMHPASETSELLVRMVQLGIDNYGLYVNGASWQGNGGHGSGRLAPILLAALALNRYDMASVDPLRFGEGQQTFFVEEKNGVINGGHGGYGPEHVGMPEWGMYHLTDPTRDTVVWPVDYRVCCTANAWVGQLMALRLMGMLRHRPWLPYVDRYLATQRALAAPAWQLHWDQPWHLQVYDALGVKDMPGVLTFGTSGGSEDFAIKATTPAHAGEVFHLHARHGRFKNTPALLVLGTTRQIPTREASVAGVTLANWRYVDPVGAPIQMSLVAGEADLNVPVPESMVGATVTVQAFVLLDDGSWAGSNAMEITVLPPTQG